MKKIVLIVLMLALAAALSTSAFAWSSADLVLDNYYWLKYNGAVGTEAYYTTTGNFRAESMNLLVDDAVAVGPTYQKNLAPGVWLGSVNTFCIALGAPMTTNEYAAKYMNLNTAKGAAYLLNKYGASNTNFAWNAALQAAVWKSLDTTNDYQLWSGPTALKLAAAQGYYTSFTTEIASLLGYGLTPGFNGNDPVNKVSQNVGTGVVPEASTLVGFGSALAMAGPGMIGWLRRRRA